MQKGKKLVLICLATQGTGNITFSWYKGALGLILETKTQRSLTAKFEIPAVTDSDTENYFCTADNGYHPSISEMVSVTVRSKFRSFCPASTPTRWAPRSPGLRADDQRG